MSYTPEEVEELDRLTIEIRHLRTYHAEIKKLQAAKLKEITDAMKQSDEWYAEQEQVFTEQVEDLVIAAEERGEELPKTFRTPSLGVVTRYKQPDKWEVDSVMFVAWARDQHNSLLRVKYEADKTAIKEYADMQLLGVEEDGTLVDEVTGEILPGVRFVPGAVEVRVK